LRCSWVTNSRYHSRRYSTYSAHLPALRGFAGAGVTPVSRFDGAGVMALRGFAGAGVTPVSRFDGAGVPALRGFAGAGVTPVSRFDGAGVMALIFVVSCPFHFAQRISRTTFLSSLLISVADNFQLQRNQLGIPNSCEECLSFYFSTVFGLQKGESIKRCNAMV